jgi:hypothetical protein
MGGGELVALVRDVLCQAGLSAVQLTGGEPLLRPDLLDILEGLRPHVRGLALVTDGALRRIGRRSRLHARPPRATWPAWPTCPPRAAAARGSIVAGAGAARAPWPPLATSIGPIRWPPYGRGEASDARAANMPHAAWAATPPE